ncbi:hypothetical protein D3C71_981130 [compost metagenome]
MIKVYLGLLSIALTSLAGAQVNNSIVSARQNRSDNFKTDAKPQTQMTSMKAEADVLWSNNFSTPSDWTMGNNGAGGNPPHTLGDWTIVNALPTSLTSQAVTYNFPTTMNSASGGNFALINSDAAGNGQTQNAYIQNATSISLADSLTANGSSLTTVIYLKYTEIYRHFYDKNFVQISNNGGTTWTTIEVNPVSEVPVNTNSGNPETEIVNITAALGGGNWSNNVKIRFLYNGDYDWFWAIDDIQLVEAFDADAKFTGIFQATDIVNTRGFDYFRVPVSQTSFPGITFGAHVLNNGNEPQSTVTFETTGPSYSENSIAYNIPVGETDTVEITTPFIIPTTVGSSTINLTTNLGTPDGFPANNQKTMTLVRDQYLYGRDDNNMRGAIAQITSQDGAELKIGNLMEIFNTMTLTGIQVRLTDQSTAVNQEINCVIELYNPNTQAFDYLGETEYYQIQAGDLDNFITIPLTGGDITIPQGSMVLVMAHHLGGPNEVGFGYAQSTVEGTVLGYTALGERFRLTDPGAIMIRLSENPSLSVSENAANVNVNIFPNPVVGEATIEVNGATASAITVVDLTGKVVYTTNASEDTSKVSFSTANFSAGVYTVNVSTEKGTITKKMVVKN